MSTRTINGQTFEVVSVKGVTYLRDDGGMLWRHFVTVDANGVVTGDTEAGREVWHGVGVPDDLIDVTDHPQWAGLGTLVGCTRASDGTFSEPPPRVARKLMSRQAALRFFTSDEYELLFTSTDPAMAHAVEIFRSSDIIDATDPVIALMMAYCVAHGVMTKQRSDELSSALLAATGGA